MKNRISEHLIQQTCLVTALLFCLQPATYAHGFINQAQSEVRQLEPGLSVEREIAGGESHTYEVSLTAGQFVRFRLDQRAINAALVLTAPDGKQLVEINLTRAGEQESLSLEAAATGIYRLTVRGTGVATLHGSYRLAATAPATATARDRKRLTAEALLIEGNEPGEQSGEKTLQLIEKLQQALPIWRELGDPLRTAWTLRKIGIAYFDLSRFEKAIEYREQALAIYRELKDRVNEAEGFNGLGFSYVPLGRFEKAVEYHEQALAISREVKARSYEGEALAGLGNAYRSQSRYDKAIESYEQSLAIFSEIKDRANEGEALKGLAIVEWKRGNLAQARTHIERSLRVAESLRSDLISPESRISFLASVQSSYQFYTDLLMSQHHANPAKGLDALAVEVSERQRARSLLDLLNEAHADVRQGVDPALLERERILGRQLNDKAQQLAQANKAEQVAALKQEISQLETDYERAQADIRKASPHYAALVQPRPLKLKEIQAQLDSDTLLLEYALGEERSYLWAITQNSLTSYELPKEVQIKQSALGVYELLTARSATKRGESALQRRERVAHAEAKLPDAAQQLSQTLLAPVAAQLGDKRLVIVDIYNLELPAELVVLSACQTGLGNEIKGEGLVGLTRGFMYAGAARVLVSLWNVNDKATADLMTKFYERMLKQGERPAAALRAAQVEMWRQKQWQSPYYWAAFVLQGDWK